MDYSVVSSRIIEAFKEVLALEKPAYLVVRLPRGAGKTHTLIGSAIKLIQRRQGYIFLYVSATIEQARDLVEINGYHTKAGIDINSPDWVRIGTKGYHYIPSGGKMVYAGVGNEKTKEANRGKHPHLIWHDEAQLYQDPHGWLQIFGEMGQGKNCIKIVSGTGGKDESNLLTFVENGIKMGNFEGRIVKIDIDELCVLDPSEGRLKWREQKIKEHTEYRTVIDEKTQEETMEILIRGDEVPEYYREFKLLDYKGSTKGFVKYPHFKESANTFEDEYTLDLSIPLYISMDYGTTDAYTATFSQIKNDVVYTFHEMYNAKKSTRTQIMYGRDLADTLEFLKIAECKWIARTDGREDLEIKFLHQDIVWIGDNNGGSNWNPYLEELLRIRIQGANTIGAAEEGVNLIGDFITTRQMQLSRWNCPNTIRDIVTIKGFDKIDPTFHLSIDHNKSHLIVTLSYLYQYLLKTNQISMSNTILKDVRVPVVIENYATEEIVPLSYTLKYLKEKRKTKVYNW